MAKWKRALISAAAGMIAVVLTVAAQRYFGGQYSGALTGGVGFGAVVLTWVLTGF